MTKLLLSGLVDLPRVSLLLAAFGLHELGPQLHLGASQHHPAPSPTLIKTSCLAGILLMYADVMVFPDRYSCRSGMNVVVHA